MQPSMGHEPYKSCFLVDPIVDGYLLKERVDNDGDSLVLLLTWGFLAFASCVPFFVFRPIFLHQYL
jgi:hypothetical protein